MQKFWEHHILKLMGIVRCRTCTRCIQNQIEILKYWCSAASGRLIDKTIFKDQSKMDLSYKSCFSLRPSWAPPGQITDSQFVPSLPAAAMKKEQDFFE
jgi:hypothetical protein